MHMISQDVIHAFYLPALRIQMDVLPDRYTNLWFKADRTGSYHLFCSEYCGTDHSVMGGHHHGDGARRLRAVARRLGVGHLAGLGRRSAVPVLRAARVATRANRPCGAPSLVGLYGKPVPMEDGRTLVADDSYIRDKILDPNDNLIAGYKQVMPAFKGVIAEDDLLRLVAYIKSTGIRTGSLP